MPEVQFSSFVKGGALSNHERNFFRLRNFENRPLKAGNFLSGRSKTSFAPEIQLSIKLSRRHFKLISYRQVCYRSS